MTPPTLPSPGPGASSAADPDAGDRPGPLVSAAWLAAHLDDPDVLLLHVSPDRRVYARRHLPGAVFVPLHRDLAAAGTDPATGGARREWLVPGRPDVETALGRWGARRGPGGAVPRLVFYDDRGLNRQAIRGYWLLRLYRYPADRLHVLDGGLGAWIAAGGPVTAGGPATADPPPRPADPAPADTIELGERDGSLLATADEVRAWSAEASAPGGPTRLLDVRSPDEFVGADGHGARRAGRIPGARHRYFGDLVRADGTLRSVGEGIGLVRGSGADPAEIRATYCMGGVRAALAWFVLHELGGYAEVRNYAGSWEEWGNRSDVPIEADR